MRSCREVEHVLELARSGWSRSAIARETGVPRTTVRSWVAGRTPRRADAADVIAGVPAGAYAYLLGL